MASKIKGASDKKYIRMVHVAPVHDDVQVQVLGAVHVPPF